MCYDAKTLRRACRSYFHRTALRLSANASARKRGFALANEPGGSQRSKQAARSARLGIASNRVRRRAA